jgi:ABC-type amino acid transport substrate-binding protein
MKTIHKIMTVTVLFFIVLIAAAFQLFREDKGVVSPDIESVSELSGTQIGGVTSRMPDNSAQILFESLLGVKLSGYQSYQNIFETLAALRTNEIEAAWFPDVTADYLISVEEGLKRIDTNEATEPRLDFALALKSDAVSLRDDINTALASLKENGTLAQLESDYIKSAVVVDKYTEKDMDLEDYDTDGTIYIGVTGAVWPIDMVDLELKPYGYSVALMNEIGKIINKKVEFVTLHNDTAFSSLMSGKVDALFCYGTSKTTLTDVKSYITTSGYYTMNQYSYLVLE